MNNLIGISGKIGSGKDTVGRTLLWLVLKSDYQIKKFASKTTEAFELITGINYHELSREDKEEIRPQYIKFAEKQKEVFGDDVWVNALFADYNTPNKVEVLYDGVVDKSESYTTGSNWIITDVRFPNEAKAIKNRGGIVIRVNRPIYKIFDVTGSREDILIPFVKEYKREPTKEELNSLRIGEDGKYLEGKEHPSETALDNYKFDHVINNDGTIEELVEKVKELKL